MVLAVFICAGFALFVIVGAAVCLLSACIRSAR